jgi:hypothetical protein
MSEVVKHIPESVAHARPKEEQTALTHPDPLAMVAAWRPGRKTRQQAAEDIARFAEMRKGISEAVDRYWENMARQEEQKIPWWVLLLVLLGAILTAETDQQGEAQPSESPI